MSAPDRASWPPLPSQLPQPRPPSIELSSVGLAPEQHHATWAMLLADVFVVEPAADLPPAPWRCVAWHLGNVALSHTTSGAYHYRRTPDLIARTESSYCFLIQLYMGGSFEGVFDGRPVKVVAGDICLFDLSRPIESFSPYGDVLSLAVPHEALESVRQIEGLHGTVLQPHGEAVTDLSSLLRALSTEIGHLSLQELGDMASALDYLILAGLRENAQGEPPGRHQHSFTDIRRHVEQNLHRSDLSAESLAPLLGMTPLALDSLFAPHDGFDDYVLRLRLSLAWNRLARIKPTDPVGPLARGLGFDNDTTFVQAFSDHFGIPPAALVSAGPEIAPAELPMVSGGIMRWALTHRDSRTWPQG